MGWYTVDSCFDAACESGTDKAVLLAIARVKNEKTGSCFATRDTIARMASVSAISVTRSIKALVKAGHITTKKKTSKHGFIYSFVFSNDIEAAAGAQRQTKCQAETPEGEVREQRPLSAKPVWGEARDLRKHFIKRAEAVARALYTTEEEVSGCETIKELRELL